MLSDYIQLLHYLTSSLSCSLKCNLEVKHYLAVMKMSAITKISLKTAEDLWLKLIAAEISWENRLFTSCQPHIHCTIYNIYVTANEITKITKTVKEVVSV